MFDAVPFKSSRAGYSMRTVGANGRGRHYPRKGDDDGAENSVLEQELVERQLEDEETYEPEWLIRWCRVTASHHRGHQ